MIKLRALYIFLILCIPLIIHGQNIRFDHLDINDGLSQNSAFCMDIDSNGYIWVGTLNGLNRYDGYSFEVFKPTLNKKGSLVGSFCSAIGCDSVGNTWIATSDGGLNKYDALQQNFIFYNDSLFSPFSTQDVQTIKVDKQGWVWLQSNSKTVAFNPIDSTLTSPLPQTSTLDITLLSNGNIGALGRFGLHEMVLSTDSTFTLIHKIKEFTSAIAYTNNKTVILHKNNIAIYAGSLSHPPKRHYFRNIENGSSIRTNQPLLVDSNKIWIGGNGGLMKYEMVGDSLIYRNYKYNVNDPNSLRAYQINNLVKDRAGNIWIGTSKHGINIISKRKNNFKHINWKQGQYKNVEIDLMRAICASSRKEYWLGFDRTGLGIIDSTGKQTLINTYIDNTGKQQALNGVRTIFEDTQKNIWVGMLKGVCIYNRETQKLEHLNLSEKINWNDRTYSIKQFSDDKVAMGIGSSLIIVDLKSKTDEQFISIKTNVSSSIRDLVIDNEFVWLGMDSRGIVRINIKTKKTMHLRASTTGLSNSKIYSLSKINNDLWIATNNGLNKLNTRTNKVEDIFYEEHGLSNNIVYSLKSNDKNDLWMSTNRGISKLNTQTNQFTTYLKSDFFMDDASFFAKDGTIYYGGYTGVVYFNPIQMQSKGETINPLIQNFSLFNNIIKPKEIVNKRVLLNKQINTTSLIQLNHFENTFSFNFSAIPFDIPNSNRFRYKLINWQNSWIDGDNKSAKFTNVLPGEYKFLLSVSGSDENWSAPKQITIIITPPFWQKLWFKMMILGFIFLLLFILYRWRVYSIHQRNRFLKQQVEKQTKDIIIKSNEIKSMSDKLHEADEAKLRFFTNISHEFRTPLTLILGYLDEIEDTKSLTVKKVIKNNALRLLRLVNQLIEFRKLDQDQLKLDVSHFELNAFVGEIVESFQKLADQKNISLSYEPNTNRIPVWLDVDKTEKILFNLISNAIKYTPKNNPIIISTSEDPQRFSIQVEDYGIGISKEELTQVFDRFFRSQNSSESGHGIGLALAKGLVEMQHGSLSVNSEKGKGSVFIAHFFKGKDHFEENEIATKKITQTNFIDKEEEVAVAIPEKNISNKTVLIVEDDPELSTYLQKILSVEYTVTCAENGVSALQQLENIYPDLIISDITMPQMDGITFCKKVKENVVTAKIPFILLTAKTDSITRIEGFKMGIDDYIEKPFNKQVLIARVEALLSNREKLQQAPTETTTMSTVDKSKFSINDVQFWKKTNTIINRNYGNPSFTTEILSEKLNMSRSTFYRKFKGLSGENAADYIRKIRLHKAAELLQKKELNIQQISMEVGFQSTSHFRTKFKDYFGINPSEYSG